MVPTVRISIRLNRYSCEEIIADIFGALLVLHRAARRIYQLVAALSRFTASLVKKVLIGILIAEIVGFTMIFIAFVIFAVLALFTSK